MTEKKSPLLSNCYHNTLWLFLHSFIFVWIINIMDGPLKKLRPGSKVGDEWLWSGFTTHSETLSTESDLPSLFAHNDYQDFYEFAIDFMRYFEWACAKVGENILLWCRNQMIQRWCNPAIFNIIRWVAGSSHWRSVWNPFNLFSYYFL